MGHAGRQPQGDDDHSQGARTRSRNDGQHLQDHARLAQEQRLDGGHGRSRSEEQKQSPGEVIGRVAVRMGLVTEAQLSEALAEQWGMQVVNLKETTITPKVLELVPETMASIYKIMPVSLKNNVLTVAMGDPDLKSRSSLRAKSSAASPSAWASSPRRSSAKPSLSNGACRSSTSRRRRSLPRCSNSFPKRWPASTRSCPSRSRTTS